MAIRTVNGSIPLDDNASGNPDFPGRSQVLEDPSVSGNQKSVKKDVAQLVVTDKIVAPGGDVVEIASIA